MANTRETLGEQATLDGLINHTLTSFEEDGVTTLGNYALYRNSALTSVKFPNLTNTGQYSFQYCTGLQHITADQFPNLTTIGSYAFANCTNLVDAEFSAVTSIQSSAFSSCSNLEKVDLKGASPVNIQSAFSSCSKMDALFVRSTTKSTISSGGLNGTKIGMTNGAVYVPTDLVDTYKADSNWKVYFIADINDYPVTEFSTIRDSWETILANEANGTYSTKYSIGDTKQIDLGTYGKHYFEIIAFDTDDKADGSGKAKITWLSKTLITTHAMNSSQKTLDGITSYTVGGWENSDMRAWLKSDVKPLLPETVRNAIVPVTKVSSTYTTALVKDGQTTTDDVWIPGDREIFNNTNNETTGAVYNTRFTSSSNRIKYNSAGSAGSWWLRSAYSANYFRYVSSSGGEYYDGAHGQNGVALGFCI